MWYFIDRKESTINLRQRTEGTHQKKEYFRNFSKSKERKKVLLDNEQSSSEGRKCKFIYVSGKPGEDKGIRKMGSI